MPHETRISHQSKPKPIEEIINEIKDLNKVLIAGCDGCVTVCEAGAQFIQTQCIYNMDKFKLWMKGVVEMGLHEKVFIMAGITPMKTVGMAKYMKARVPGMDVPDEIVKRMGGVPKDKQAEEGIKIAIEQIQELKEVKGVAGFHVMAIEWEEKVGEIVERAGLLPRPKVD